MTRTDSVIAVRTTLEAFFRAKDPEKRTPVEIKGISVKENKEPDPESIWKENDNIKGCKI